MSSKIMIASAIQTMCNQIIGYINLMHTISLSVDDDGLISDLYECLGGTSQLLESIGKQIEQSKGGGYVDVMTLDNKVIVNAIMKYNNVGQMNKIVMGNVDITNFFVVQNQVPTGAVFGQDYFPASYGSLYPSPYDNFAYGSNLASLANGFKIMTDNMNVFTGNKSGSSNAIPTVKIIQNNVPSTNISDSNSVLGGVVNDLQIITTNTVLSNVSGNTGRNSYAIGVDTSLGAITISLPIDTARCNGRTYYIFDVGGNGNKNNITISGNGVTICGNISVAITTNYGAITLIYSSVKNEWFLI